MAKSLRSKHKRKMRAVKREKNAPKELARLIKTLDVDKDVMETDMVTVTDAKAIKETKEKKEEMDIDGKGFDRKTRKNEHGQYLPWMNQRAIRKAKSTTKNSKGKKQRVKLKGKGPKAAW